jgi:hypothetical protein
MYSDCLLNISHHGERPVEDIFLSEEPRGFQPSIFHFDVSQNEIGLQRLAPSDQPYEERIGHYLASGAGYSGYTAELQKS